MKPVEQFLKKRTGRTEPYYREALSEAARRPAGISVVIPLYDEYPGIIKTLDSLEESLRHAEVLNAKFSRVCAVCVVNNRAGDSDAAKANNRETLKVLREYGGTLDMCVIDAASAGREIPEGQGAGFARKIGMDYAAVSCAADGAVIACMDGDTLVSQNYIAALAQFAASKKLAALTEFSHQKADTPQAEKAVRAYEDFLRDHSRRLAGCGTPFYHIALGPTIVCSAQAYCQAGGMNTRQAGEDFYFLQELTKICLGKNQTIDTLDCAVYPQSRISRRVPFGTGQKIAELTSGVRDRNPPGTALGYPPFVYDQIAFFIAKMTETAHNGAPVDAREFSAARPALYGFLLNENFFAVWEKILKNTAGAANLSAEHRARRRVCAFHTWFDGLKIIRLIHRLRNLAREPTASGLQASELHEQHAH
jgi:glycosyltransferase involved in cell wall biosynthesis